MGLGWVLNPKPGTLLREEDRQIQGDKDDVQMGAEIAVTLPQAKEARAMRSCKRQREPRAFRREHSLAGTLIPGFLMPRSSGNPQRFAASPFTFFSYHTGSQAKVIRNEDSRRLAFPAWFPGFYPAS